MSIVELETKQAKAEREELEAIQEMVRIRRIVYNESLKAGWTEADALWLCYVHEQE
jgi:hypothetical protein